MVDCYFWLLDDEDAAAPLDPPPGLSRLKREMWKKKARKGTLSEAAWRRMKSKRGCAGSRNWINWKPMLCRRSRGL
jgi:hypothetical protein